MAGDGDLGRSESEPYDWADDPNLDLEETLRRFHQFPLDEVEVKPYVPGTHDCCCGNPECTDFEDRMRAWGIPLDEITTTMYSVSLKPMEESSDER